MRIIALNGPPLAGKTTIAGFLSSSYSYTIIEPSMAFKRSAHQLFGREFTDDQKDETMECLGGFTPRDLYIDVATTMEVYDPRIWIKRAVLDGVKLMNGHHGPGINNYVIDSLGKQRQMDWLEEFAKENSIELVLFYVSRPGKSFTDGREVVTPSDGLGNRHAIFNTGDKEYLFRLVSLIVSFLK